MKKLLLILIILIFPSFVFAADFPEKSDKLVNDYVKVIGDVEGLESKLSDFQKKTNTRMVVVVLPVKGDLDVYTDDLFSNWNLGGREDNGILFLISSEQKKAAMKLSYGILEKIKSEQITDLLDQGINPALAEGNYASAANLGVKNLEKIIKGEYTSVQDKKSNNWVFGIIFLFVALFIIIASAYGRQERRRIIYNKGNHV